MSALGVDGVQLRGGWIEQEYAPPDARSGPYHQPTDLGHEAEVRKRIAERRDKKDDP